MKYVILAGGSGTRLWPLSRRNFAKQFLNLVNDKSMLQDTACRVSKQNGKDIFIISNKDSEFVITKQLSEILTDYKKENLIVEPIARNTAPAIAYGCLFFKPDDVIVILSSDHYIKDEKKFNNTLMKAEKIANKGYIVTLGIIPDSPKTGYGYIKKGSDKILEGFKVEKFVEKPDDLKAKEYIKDGNYFWNAGIFIFKVSVFLEELKKYSTDVFRIFEGLQKKQCQGKEITKKDFIKFPKISVDYAVMEKSDLLVVTPGDFGWSDIGSYKSLYEILDKDKNNNALKIKKDDFININSKNIQVFGCNRKIAAINLKNLSIIDTPDAILVADNNNTEEVKKVVEKLEEMKAPECMNHINACMPWGSYTILSIGENYQLRLLSINPCEKILFQQHKTAVNTYTVIDGITKITKNQEIITLNRSESITIPSNIKYCLTNPLKDKVLKLIEVQLANLV